MPGKTLHGLSPRPTICTSFNEAPAKCRGKLDGLCEVRMDETGLQ